MKAFFIIILCFTAIPSFSQLRIFSFEAKQHIGDTVLVDGITVSVQHSDKEKATYVYYGKRPPNQDLTIMINDADLKNFSDPIHTLFTQRFATVIGKIILIKSQPVIVARSLKDFSPNPGQ